MTQRILLLNAPPEAGKDTAADYLAPLVPDSFQFKMSQPLKDAVRAIFSLTDAEYDLCEANKGSPLPLLLNHSFRNWQIDISESLVKPRGGSAAFGYLAHRKLSRRNESVLISSDTGFDDEVTPLLPLCMRADGTLDVVLVHIYRPGKDFSKDSRNYIQIPGVTPIRIDNDQGTAEYYEKLRQVILPLLLAPIDHIGMATQAA